VNEPIAVEVRGELRQIKSMADGTYNVIINLPLDMIEETRALMGWILDEVKIVMVNETKAPIKTDGKRDRPRARRKVLQGE
jgi:hypothetical protein